MATCHTCGWPPRARTVRGARDAQGFPGRPLPGARGAAARRAGVLLIVRMVPPATLVAMLDCAAELGLFVLLEAFDAADLAVAASSRARAAVATNRC